MYIRVKCSRLLNYLKIQFQFLNDVWPYKMVNICTWCAFSDSERIFCNHNGIKEEAHLNATLYANTAVFVKAPEIVKYSLESRSNRSKYWSRFLPRQSSRLRFRLSPHVYSYLGFCSSGYRYVSIFFTPPQFHAGISSLLRASCHHNSVTLVASKLCKQFKVFFQYTNDEREFANSFHSVLNDLIGPIRLLASFSPLSFHDRVIYLEIINPIAIVKRIIINNFLLL